MNISPNEIYYFLSTQTHEDVRKAYIQRVRDENDRRDSTRAWLAENGYIEIPSGQYDGRRLTDYGAPIYDIYERRYALDEASFNSWREQAIEAAKKQQGRVEVPPSGVEAMASFSCGCGGSIQKTGVCPSCTFGKAGYKFRYTCDSCDVDMLTNKDMDSHKWGEIS